jgi:sortase A
LLEIPAIGVDEVVVEGTRTADLRNGPGHFPESPLPGQLGNSAIAGHRTTYGAPFYRVDELRSGDPIIVTTLTGRYVYEVTEVFVISADDYGSAVPTNDRTVATLTLISCHPRYTARQRIIVRASLVLAESAPPAAAPTEVKPPDAAQGDDLPDDGSPETAPPDNVGPTVDTKAAGTPTTSDTTSDSTTATTAAPAAAAPADVDAPAAAAAESNAFNEGWFSDSGAFAQVALWGILLSAVALAAYAVSRRARRNWVGLLTGVIPFVIVLYFFFQNVNRLLPPGL